MHVCPYLSVKACEPNGTTTLPNSAVERHDADSRAIHPVRKEYSTQELGTRNQSYIFYNHCNPRTLNTEPPLSQLLLVLHKDHASTRDLGQRRSPPASASDAASALHPPRHPLPPSARLRFRTVFNSSLAYKEASSEVLGGVYST